MQGHVWRRRPFTPTRKKQRGCWRLCTGMHSCCHRIESSSYRHLDEDAGISRLANICTEVSIYFNYLCDQCKIQMRWAAVIFIPFCVISCIPRWFWNSQSDNGLVARKSLSTRVGCYIETMRPPYLKYEISSWVKMSYFHVYTWDNEKTDR